VKNFPAVFLNALARKTGLAPIWILKLSVGGNDYYLSDQVATISAWNVTTLPWVSEWGDISEGLSGNINEIRISDFELRLLVDPDATPNAENLVIADDLESAPVSLFLMVEENGLEPQEIGRYFVDGVELPDEVSVRLVLVDESSRLQSYVGQKVTLDVYPGADPDDVGKVVPIPVGNVSRVPALAVGSGAVTSIPMAITAIATAFDVSNASGLSIGMEIAIDDELMTVTGVSGDRLTVTRAVDAVSHSRGAMVLEQRSEFVYLASSVPIDSFGKILGCVGQAEIDIRPICTLYTGKSGQEHVSYPGQAVVSVPGRISVSQAVDLLISDSTNVVDGINVLDGISINNGLSVLDGMTVDDGIALVNGISISDTIAVLEDLAIANTLSVYDTIGVSDGIGVSTNSHDHTHDLVGSQDQIGSSLPQTFGGSSYTTATGTPTFSAPAGSVIEGTYEYELNWSWIGSIGTCEVRVNNVLVQTASAGSVAWSGTVSGGTAPLIQVRRISGTGVSFTITVAKRSLLLSGDIDPTTQSVAKTGSASKTGEATLTGNVVQSGSVSKTGAASLSGTVDRSGSVARSGEISLDGDVTRGGSVTKSGTIALTGSTTLSGNSVANTLIGDAVLVEMTRNLTVVEAFNSLLSPLGFAPVQQVGSLPVGYDLNGAITGYRSAHAWLDLWSFQLRSWFRVSCGVPKLIVRPDAPVSLKTIFQPAADGSYRKVWARKKTSRDELINSIQLLYDRDWSQPAGEGSYRAVASAEDVASIAIHGKLERPELWLFDFVSDQTMAESVRDFYLRKYASRRWIHEFKTYLDHAEFEFSDGVTIGWDGNQVGEITQVNHAPGDIGKMDMVGFVVEV
jgi:hypothetical protein